MNVYNDNDLRIAYELLALSEKMAKQYNKELRTSQYYADTKKNIRRYNNEKNTELTEKYIKADNDGYLVLQEMPYFLKTIEEAEKYFNYEMRLTAIPSQYDCTGQRFTISHKICKRHNRFFVYHQVGIDV